jgi:hypothetical protein
MTADLSMDKARRAARCRRVTKSEVVADLSALTVHVCVSSFPL